MPLTDDKFDSLDQRQSPLMNKFDLLDDQRQNPYANDSSLLLEVQEVVVLDAVIVLAVPMFL